MSPPKDLKAVDKMVLDNLLCGVVFRDIAPLRLGLKHLAIEVKNRNIDIHRNRQAREEIAKLAISLECGSGAPAFSWIPAFAGMTMHRAFSCIPALSGTPDRASLDGGASPSPSGRGPG